MRYFGAAALLLPLPAPAAAPQFQDGLWQVIVTAEIRGANVKRPPPLNYEHCFTREDFEPHLSSPNSPCRAVDIRRKESEMSWRLQCVESAGDMQGHGRVKFAGSRVEGVVVTFSKHPEDMQVIQKITARRLGPCNLPGTRLPGKPRPPLQDYRDIAPEPAAR
jgi:hypothetical protein